MGFDATFVDLHRGHTTRTSWNEPRLLLSHSSSKLLASGNWKRCKRIRLLAHRLSSLNPSVRNLDHHHQRPVFLAACVSPPKKPGCYLCTILRFPGILASNPRSSMASLSGKHTRSVRRSYQKLGWTKSTDINLYLVLTLSRRIAGNWCVYLYVMLISLLICRAQKCAACAAGSLKSHGAPVQCTKGKCSRSFHVSCAKEGLGGTFFRITGESYSDVLLNVEAEQNLPSTGEGPSNPPNGATPALLTPFVLKTITKNEIELFCAQHNPVRRLFSCPHATWLICLSLG